MTSLLVEKLSPKSWTDSWSLKIEYNLRNVRSNRLNEWIPTLIDRGIQHLDVKIKHPFFVVMPRNIYKSKTLVSLKLSNVGFKTQDELSLPCLKIMHLEEINYGKVGPLFIEKLISSCPVLEDLTLVQSDFHKYMRLLSVRSQTLKIFRLLSDWSDYKTEFSVEIDAPGLECMSFIGRAVDRIVVKNMSSSVKIHLHTDFNVDQYEEPEDLDPRKSYIIGDFLTGISSVRNMIISLPTLEVIYRYSELLEIPKFHNLSHLQASFSYDWLQFLPVFLDNCPNLKNLILTESYISHVNSPVGLTNGVDLTNGNVPRCLTSTMEYVRIKDLYPEEENGIDLVNYFLENSAILKKLILRFKDYHPVSNNDSDIIMKQLTSTKLSTNCQVFVD